MITSHAAQVTISPTKDNTLYQDEQGLLSNGAGEYFFAGRVGLTSNGTIRRGLIAFDVAGGVPAGATITNASLQLTMSKSTSGATNVALHKALADWGEGVSNAGEQSGGGAAATTNDATWTKRFFGTANDWTTPGGDFAATASASTSVNATGNYAWSSAGMLADVQEWYTAPASNFGWVLVGDEGSDSTAKRYNTKENITASTRPALTITYSTGSGINEWTLY
jgi:hypothetical protein